MPLSRPAMQRVKCPDGIEPRPELHLYSGALGFSHAATHGGSQELEKPFHSRPEINHMPVKLQRCQSPIPSGVARPALQILPLALPATVDGCFKQGRPSACFAFERPAEICERERNPAPPRQPTRNFHHRQYRRQPFPFELRKIKGPVPISIAQNPCPTRPVKNRPLREGRQQRVPVRPLQWINRHKARLVHLPLSASLQANPQRFS